jgi:manganese/zinc/iron transport system substrate-binding protein
MHRLTFKYFAVWVGLVALFLRCSHTPESPREKPLIVTTTNIVNDMVVNLVGDSASVKAIMGAGVDPHYYKTKKSDVDLLMEADVVVYNGFRLEGKMVSVLEKMAQSKPTMALSDGLSEACRYIIDSTNTVYDPHFWFDPAAWIEATHYIKENLARAYPHWEEYLAKNEKDYIQAIKSVTEEVKNNIHLLPENQRILITSHDAFHYFGRAFDFEVRGLQGISTLSESGVKDVTNLINYIIENEVKAVFVESSVPKKKLESVVEGCQKKGHNVKVGGELFSDALGEDGSPGGTYVGMLRHNVNTIVNGLK